LFYPPSYFLPGVAPRAGAWVETRSQIGNHLVNIASHPVRVRGLKLLPEDYKKLVVEVAPRAGAWVETLRACQIRKRRRCRTPCGCVG